MVEISFHTTYSDNRYLLTRAENGYQSGLHRRRCHRFGFNGKENDNEVKGTGNSVDFGARIYDSRICVFLSIDPKFKDYASVSPYIFAAENPILFIDFNGEGPRIDRRTRTVSADIRIRYVGVQTLTLAQRSQIQSQILNDVTNGLNNNGINSNITVTWDNSRGGLFGSGFMAGWFSNRVYFNIDDGPNRSQAVKAGNKGRFRLNDVGINTVPFHEFCHVLGLSDRYNYAADYDRSDGTVNTLGSRPMSGLQVNTEGNNYNGQGNIMGNGGQLTPFQIGVVFRQGVRYLRKEQNYKQIVAFVDGAGIPAGITSVDFVRKEVYINGLRIGEPDYLFANPASNGNGRGSKSGESIWRSIGGAGQTAIQNMINL